MPAPDCPKSCHDDCAKCDIGKSPAMPLSSTKVLAYYHREIGADIRSNRTAQSAAWRTIYQYCVEKGMEAQHPDAKHVTPLEQVCLFISRQGA